MSKVLHNILYVEDEPDIQRVVKLALEAMAGMHVIGCSSGAEAIARSADAAIDLILLDVMMPGMDGPTTLSRLREIPALAHTPVVFMTAKAHPSEIAYFKTLGALDVIAKPFDPMTLAATLRAIWARASTATQPAQTFTPQTSASEANRTTHPVQPSAEERFAARMVELTAQFHRELPARRDTLQQQWQTLRTSWSLETLNALHGSTHNLAGLGSTFGYDELTARSRARSSSQSLAISATAAAHTMGRQCAVGGSRRFGCRTRSRIAAYIGATRRLSSPIVGRESVARVVMSRCCDIQTMLFKRRVPLIILMLLSIVLSSCSVFYSYRNIDRYIRWSIDDYINWNSTQEQQLREQLWMQLQWHRATQLPRYRAWLQARLTEMDGEVNAAQWRNAAQQLQVFWQDAMTHATDDVCAQLATLSDRQARDLIAVMREKQRDRVEEFAEQTPAEAIKQRRRSMEKAVKYWLGSLDDKQRELIATCAREFPDTRQGWFDSRTRWTDAFERALAHRHDPEVFAMEIQRLFATPQENWDDEYRVISQQSLEINVQLFAALHSMGSVRQREAERERIAQWLGILDNLAN